MRPARAAQASAAACTAAKPPGQLRNPKQNHTSRCPTCARASSPRPAQCLRQFPCRQPAPPLAPAAGLPAVPPPASGQTRLGERWLHRPAGGSRARVLLPPTHAPTRHAELACSAGQLVPATVQATSPLGGAAAIAATGTAPASSTADAAAAASAPWLRPSAPARLLKDEGLGTRVSAKCSARSRTSAPGLGCGARCGGGLAAIRCRFCWLACGARQGEGRVAWPLSRSCTPDSHLKQQAPHKRRMASTSLHPAGPSRP